MSPTTNNTLVKTLALIVGAGKCGTTSLFHYLAQHPEIRSSNPKELNFFSRHWNEDPDWYWAQFEGDGDVWLEASPSYTERPEQEGVVDRIASLGLPVKVIYMVREPIARTKSRINHINASELRGPRSLEPTLSPSEELLGELIDEIRYGFQLEPYERQFPKMILVLSLDALQSDPSAVLDRVTDFLGVQRFAPMDTRKRNRIADLYAKGWVNRIRTGPLGPLVGAIIPNRLRRAVVKSATYRLPEIVLTPKMKCRILETIKPDLIHLKTRYGIDASELWDIPL